MHPQSSLLVLALPSICVAQNQYPIIDKVKGWFNQATAVASSYVPTAIPSAAIPNPVDAGAAAIAATQVHTLTHDNWRGVFAPGAGASQKDGPDEWIVLISGENITCYNACEKAEKAFNSSVALLSAAKNTPNFAAVNCDAEPLLCNSWIVAPPAVYHFLIPKPLADQSTPASTVRYQSLNRTTVATKDFVDLHNHPENVPVYEGFWHPFDGQAQKTGIVLPWAYLMWGFSQMPSWMPMILISFFSRTFMGRRMPQGQPQAGGAAPAPAAR